MKHLMQFESHVEKTNLDKKIGRLREKIMKWDEDNSKGRVDIEPQSVRDEWESELSGLLTSNNENNFSIFNENNTLDMEEAPKGTIDTEKESQTAIEQIAKTLSEEGLSNAGKIGKISAIADEYTAKLLSHTEISDEIKDVVSSFEH